MNTSMAVVLIGTKKAKTRTKTTNSRIRGNKRFRTILFIVSGHTHDYIFAFYVKEITWGLIKHMYKVKSIDVGISSREGWGTRRI